MNSEQEGAPLDWDGKLIEMKGPNLPLRRCPHCGVAKPFLDGSHTLTTGGGQSERIWRMFVCSVCSGVVLAVCFKNAPLIHDIYPSLRVFDASIPDRAREYLKQAQESVAQPVGSIMLCASAIDAMLKAKGIREGNLYPRIKKAAKEHLITDGMATWAHQVRLDANDQRHADEDADLPEPEDAKRCLDFAVALAEFLFVLPAKVTRGIKESEPHSD